MAEISQITLPSGSTYDLKDATARASIPTKVSDLTNDLGFISDDKHPAWFGTSTTAAATATKVVSCSNFTLTTGAVIFVHFTNGNSATSMALNVNNTGAKTVAILMPQSGGANTNTQNMSLLAGGVVAFVYIGSCWVWVASEALSVAHTVYNELAYKANIASPTLTGTPKAPTASAGTSTTQIATTAFVQNAVTAAQVGAATFKGTVTAGTDISELTAYSKGWYWVVATAGTYAGQTCEVGDFIFCISDYSSAYSASDFKVVQANIDMSIFGDLAYEDSASGSYTPAGSVSQPTFTGTAGTVSVSGTIASSVTLSAGTTSGTGKADVTPAGTVSQPTFSGSEMTATGSFTPSGSVTISKASSGTANYTPAGTVSQPTFTGTPKYLGGTFGPGDINSSGSFTPSGTVSKPNVTVTPTTETIYSITGVGSVPSCTLPSLSCSVANENLTLSWTAGSFSAGSVPTRASKTVMTGASAALASTPAFTGTEGTVEVTNDSSVGVPLATSSTSVTGYVAITPAGTVSQPTFTGTGAVLTGSFTGTAGSVSVKGTPAGTVSQPTFTGTAKYVTASVGTASKTMTGSFTPSGTVSKPTFTGTAGTVTVS